MHRSVFSRLRLLVALAVLALPACGGGRGHSKVYPVSGKILVNGQPAKDCLITLNPTAPPKDGTPVAPTGYTDDNGEFQLTSFANNDGAPPGEYVVTIEWRERTGLSGMNYDGPDQLGGEYAKVAQTRTMSGFLVKIESKTSLPPFELKQSAELKRQLDEKKKNPGLNPRGPIGGSQ